MRISEGDWKKKRDSRREKEVTYVKKKEKDVVSPDQYHRMLQVGNLQNYFEYL